MSVELARLNAFFSNSRASSVLESESHNLFIKLHILFDQLTNFCTRKFSNLLTKLPHLSCFFLCHTSSHNFAVFYSSVKLLLTAQSKRLSQVACRLASSSFCVFFHCSWRQVASFLLEHSTKGIIECFLCNCNKSLGNSNSSHHHAVWDLVLQMSKPLLLFHHFVFWFVASSIST